MLGTEHFSGQFFLVAFGLSFILAGLSVWILKNIIHEDITPHESEGDEPVRF